jgi:hypothetical protein
MRVERQPPPRCDGLAGVTALLAAPRKKTGLGAWTGRGLAAGGAISVGGGRGAISVGGGKWHRVNWVGEVTGGEGGDGEAEADAVRSRPPRGRCVTGPALLRRDRLGSTVVAWCVVGTPGVSRVDGEVAGRCLGRGLPRVSGGGGRWLGR